jgi:hypothetical protein
MGKGNGEGNGEGQGEGQGAGEGAGEGQGQGKGGCEPISCLIVICICAFCFGFCKDEPVET